MTTTIIHKGTERTWEGPFDNWEAHKKYIMGWCDGREVLWDGKPMWFAPGFDSRTSTYSFKIEPKEPVVFEGRLKSKTLCNDSCSLEIGKGQVSIYNFIDINKQYKITIEKVE